MRPTVFLPMPLAAILLMGLAGCHTAPEESFSSVVPLYRTAAEAQDVAVGHIGAVPIELSAEAGLEALSGCERAVVQVRARSGTVGWAPAASLPRELLAARCEAAQLPDEPKEAK